MHADYPYQDKRNRWSSHSRIAGFLEGLPEGARVLDIGSGSGTLARLCAGRGYTLRGVEPKPEDVSSLQKLYTELSTQNLEQTSDAFLASNDAVICGDVLEHLVSPEEQLRRLVNLQERTCRFIVSVPNIANFWIRLNLFLGKFDYTKRGILDRMHLHFYTRKTFTQLLTQAGLEIMEMYATPIPLELVSPIFSSSIFGKGLYEVLAQITEGWPTLLGYQFVARAQKAY